MKFNNFTYQIVEFIPEKLEEGILYISLKYETAVHKCFCGCGMETVTPLSKNGWKIVFENDTVSLSPSIGNHQFECKSHYVIIKNKVIWY